MAGLGGRVTSAIPAAQFGAVEACGTGAVAVRPQPALNTSGARWEGPVALRTARVARAAGVGSAVAVPAAGLPSTGQGGTLKGAGGALPARITDAAPVAETGADAGAVACAGPGEAPQAFLGAAHRGPARVTHALPLGGCALVADRVAHGAEPPIDTLSACGAPPVAVTVAAAIDGAAGPLAAARRRRAPRALHLAGCPSVARVTRTAAIPARASIADAMPTAGALPAPVTLHTAVHTRKARQALAAHRTGAAEPTAAAGRGPRARAGTGRARPVLVAGARAGPGRPAIAQAVGGARGPRAIAPPRARAHAGAVRPVLRPRTLQDHAGVGHGLAGRATVPRGADALPGAAHAPPRTDLQVGGPRAVVQAVLPGVPRGAVQAARPGPIPEGG